MAKGDRTGLPATTAAAPGGDRQATSRLKVQCTPAAVFSEPAALDRRCVSAPVRLRFERDGVLDNDNPVPGFLRLRFGSCLGEGKHWCGLIARHPWFIVLRPLTQHIALTMHRPVSGGQRKKCANAPDEREQVGLLAEVSIPVVESLTADQHAAPNASEGKRT